MLTDIVYQTLVNLAPTPRYWIAFSGGLDSTCLLHILASLRSRLAIPISAIHLNHGLQSNSDAWEQHCQHVCDQLDIDIIIQKLRIHLAKGESLEAIARIARLQSYQRFIAANETILTAHHQDDQIETVLLQLLRGSGLPGLAAMPVRSSLSPGWLVRPLLGITRNQLMTYAEANRLCWIEDQSNQDTKFDRNYLRHQVIPHLKQRWPKCTTTITRSASHCGAADSLLSNLVAPYVTTASGNYPGTLSKAVLLAMDVELCNAVLRFWIAQHGYPVPNHKHLAQIRNEVLTAAPDRWPVVAWSQTEIRSYRDDIFIMAPLPSKCTDTVLPWLSNTVAVLPAGLGCLRCEYTTIAHHVLAPNDILALNIRFAVTGQRCQLPNTSKKHKIRDLYPQYAIPNWLRPYIPLIYLDDQLVAIAGICNCGSVMPTHGINIGWDNSVLADLVKIIVTA